MEHGAVSPTDHAPHREVTLGEGAHRDTTGWGLYAGGSKVGGVLLVVLGGVALIGRVTGAAPLVAVRPGVAPVTATSAMLFTLFGASLWLGGSVSRRARSAGRCLIVAALALASACLLAAFVHMALPSAWTLTLRRWGLVPGPSVVTAGCFLLASIALMDTWRSHRSPFVANVGRALGVVIALVGVVVSLGYIYHAPLVFNDGRVPLAFPTAFLFVFLGLSLVIPASLREQAERRQHNRDRDHIDGAFEHAAIGMALVAPDGRFLRVNPALCKMTSYTEQELLATTFQAITHPADAEVDRAAAIRLLAGEWPSYQVEKRYITRHGDTVWVLLTTSVVRDAEGRPLYFISQMQDTTSRKRVEAGLIRQAVVFETISEAVVVTDVTGRVTDWNPAAERIFGYAKAEMLGQDAARLFRPFHRPALERAIRVSLLAAGRWSGEVTFVRRDKTRGIAEVVVVAQQDAGGEPVRWISVSRDVTERKRTEQALQRREEQLRRSQRLEAVGQLAGGMAHDFNNLLTAVKGYSELLLKQMDPDDPRSEDVRQIDRAADRAASLTRQLLAFSRRQMLRPQVFNLNRTVRDLEQMLRRLLAEHIKLVTTLEPKLWSVQADPGQIEQVIVNLVVNARDAMPGGGTLSIATANVELDERHAARHASVTAPPGQYVMLAVSDTGCGMDASTQARMFEPFFTTKEPGKGTGLGLSTVYGIVKQSGGSIWCESEVGVGTTFKVYLARAVGPGDGAARGEEPDAVRGGWETILLVEDDDAVRAVVRRALVEQGYRVHEAADGAAALRLCARAVEPIDLILTDIVMPEMDGPELVRRVQARHAQIRVLYMSGYTENATFQPSFLDPEVPFIEKPFAAHALARRVREVLDAGEAAEQRSGARNGTIGTGDEGRGGKTKS